MLQIRDLLWGLLFIGCAANMGVQINPTHGEIMEGQSKVFRCNVKGEAREIDWYAPSGEKILPNQQGFSVRRRDDATSILTILDAKVDSAGFYKCVAKTEVQASVEVKIYQDITFQSSPSPQEFNEGDDADIVCDVVSSPPPTITWKHKDSNIQFDKDVRLRILENGHLQIHSIKKTDEGWYTCEARVMVRGAIDNRRIKVVVNAVAPKILAALAVYTWEGNAANISCEVEAHPGASVLWFRDGLRLPSADSTNILIYHTPAISFLEVTPSSQDDFGSYNCKSSNVIKEFLLVQAEVPTSPNITKVETCFSSAVVEFDEPDSTGGVPIIKYRVEWRFPGRTWIKKDYEFEKDMTKITIDHLRPETIYEIKMSAINGKGQGESSPTSTFETKPFWLPSTPKIQITVTTNSLIIRIKKDDGGSFIMHYLVRYKAKHVSDWKPEIRLPHDSEYAVLSGLDWNTEYEVHVVAQNLKGKSEPGILFSRTATEPMPSLERP